MHIVATASLGADGGSGAALPRGRQSIAGQGIPFPALKPTVTKIFQMRCGRGRYFRIRGLEPLILKAQAWQSGERLRSPVPADTSAPGSLAQQKG